MAVASVVGMISISSTVHADDSVNRLLDLQLRKGIITQQEYDEFMAATDKDPRAATVESGNAGETKTQVSSPDKGANKASTESAGNGVAVIKSGATKVELFGTIDLSVGYTSHSLVQSGEMPTSIGPYISGGVRYPRTAGGAAYPSSNMSSQTGIFNSALSTSSWGIRATRDIGSDGLKAFVVLDSAINPATGQLTNQAHNESVNSRYPTTSYATSSLNGQLFAKEAVVGLSGDKWGKVRIGRNTNPINDVLGSYAPVQKAGLFSVYGNGVYGAGGGLSENGRVDTSVKYGHKIGNVNIGLLYGFGSTGGLKDGAKGFAGNLGYETDRFGIQLVYEQFKDLLKTATDSNVSNVIDLTAYNQKAALLAAKYKLTDRLHTQVGYQQANLSPPTPDVNIPFITNLYGDNVNTSVAYVGDTFKIKIAHVGVDYDWNENTNISAAYQYIGLPKYNSVQQTGGQYKGGDIDAWSGLITYKLDKGTTVYAGLIFSHYRGPAFDSTSTTIFIHDIFTTATGLRFAF
jgi:predicted porin